MRKTGLVQNQTDPELEALVKIDRNLDQASQFDLLLVVPGPIKSLKNGRALCWYYPNNSNIQ